MLQARRRCAVTVLGGDVVVLGGNSFETLKLVDRYNGRCWEAMPNLPRHLFFAAAVAVQVQGQGPKTQGTHLLQNSGQEVSCCTSPPL